MRFIIRDYSIMKLGEDRAIPATGDEPEAIYRYFRRVVAGDPAHEPDKEHLVVLCLNARLEVFGWHLTCLGTLNEVCFHPREVLRPVIMSGAYGFVLTHNHPSGDPSPSTGDDRCTRRGGGPDADQVPGPRYRWPALPTQDALVLIPGARGHSVTVRKSDIV